MYFAFSAKVFEWLNNRESLCSHCPKFSCVSVVALSNTLRVLFRCSYSIKTDHLLDNQTHKQPKGAYVSSLHHSTNDEPRLKITWSLSISAAFLGDLKRSMWTFWSSMSELNLNLWNKFSSMYIVLNQQSLFATAISSKSLTAYISWHESSKMSKCLVRLFSTESMKSKFTP